MSTNAAISTSRDVVFHLLDLQARDMRIESEQEDVREVAYESNSDDDDDEVQTRRKRSRMAQGGFTQQKEFVIHLFGADENGRPIRCDVTGFRPTLYIRLPEEKTSQCADAIKQYINGQGIPMGQLGIKRVMKKVFYGFTANTFFPFMQIDVPSLTMFRNLRNLFLDENLKPQTKKPLDGPLRGKTIEIFEANIDPMLRFVHSQNIQPCGWVMIKDGKASISEDGDSGIVIECDYEQVVPTRGPRVAAPFLTASWDIECFSMTGDFPLAKRTWKKAAKDLLEYATDSSHAAELLVNSLSTGQNPVSTLPKGMTPVYCQLKKPLETVSAKMYEADTQNKLQAILNLQGDKDIKVLNLDKLLGTTLRNHVCLVGDPVIQIGTTLTRGTPETTERHLFVFPDCDPIDGIIVHAYRTEKAMILAWFEWMIERNPDILIGYNVFGFDESYLWHRAEELGLINSNSPIHQFTRLFALSSEVKLEEKFLSSSAMGDNFMYIWSVHGRLQVDLFHYIKRNNVLPSYKLDEVTKHFMSGKLKGQTYEPGRLVLEVAGAVKDVKVGRAIALLDETGETVSPKLVVEAVEGNKIRFAVTLDEDEQAEMVDATKWVIVKDDVGPQDIFRLHRESSAGRAVVGKYCLQDCDLVIDLYRKLETFNNTMCMANVCSVPVSYIFTRGQGIKIESLIFKACRERDVLIPVLTSPKQGAGAEDSYEGAIVLNPDPGFYSDSPIGVCDFASLYPSTIVSENISHDSLLWIKDFNYDGTLISHNWGSEVYDECEGYAYTDIEFDIWRPDPNDHRKHPVKVKCGRRICRYAQPLDGTKSTLPQITTWLLQAREAKKKEMKGEKDPERYALLDAEQLAYKLTGNSLYGQLGSGTFKIRLQALAASVTAYGRKQILFAKEAIEKFYGPGANDPRCAARCMAKVVYGDSVTGDTPLVLKNNQTGALYIRRIDELYSDDIWNTYHTTKESINMNNKDISVWTERGFTPIKKLIRHKLHPNKKLYRINTHTGVVDVTEDHSLVLKDGTEVKPESIKVGTELLHSDTAYEEFDKSVTKCTITENEAFVMGLFVADGSSDVYDCPSGKKASWAINKSDIGLLVTAMNKCPFETKILNTIESSGVYKLIPVGDIVTPAKHYRELFYNEHREKRIPDTILNAPNSVIEAFWNGFYCGDGDKDNNGYIRFDQKGKEIGAGMYIIARRLGYSVSINERASKESTFRYTMTTGVQRKNAIAIKKLRELPHPGPDAFVYDLETENHHFGVGPGALIVHNTDSLFVEFNPRNPETGERLTGREARQATIDITDEAGAFITKTLAAPHDFEFDKAFDPMLMFSKKRYAGNMYENNADDYVHKYMGIALKRRDNAPIVKTIFGGAMKMLLDKRDVDGAFKFVKEKCLELVEGKVSLGQLTVTKSLRADYANPLSIAHKVLADRITARDPGNAPAAGDRIGYVYISAKSGQEAAKLQGDRIETPQFVRENNLIPDYKHYIEHQLQNPISQAFGLLLERIPGFQPAMLAKCPSKPDTMDGSLEADKMLDGWLAFRESIAAQLLFADCLKKFETGSRRNAIVNMFGDKAIIATSGRTSAARPQNQVITAAKTVTAPAKPAAIKPPVQMTMSSFLLDSMIVGNIRKQERKAATEAKKKIKEQAAAAAVANSS
jgi:DNA polymerase elongation subunit (family B)